MTLKPLLNFMKTKSRVVIIRDDLLKYLEDIEDDTMQTLEKAKTKETVYYCKGILSVVHCLWDKIAVIEY